MRSIHMSYQQLREQAEAVGMAPHEFVRGRKSAGTLVEIRPQVEPGRSLRRRAQFRAVAPANTMMAPCGRLRIGAEDIS